MMSRASLLLLLLLNASCALYWLRHTEPTIKDKREEHRVPLRMVGTLPLVEVYIDEQPFWFVVDTGAPISAIDPRVAKILSKKKYGRPAISVGGASEGKKKGRLLRFSGLRLGDLAIESILAVELDLQEIESAMGLTLGGILGLSVFQEYLLTIDYPARELVLQRGALPDADQREVFAYQVEKGHIALSMTLAGQPLSVVLDSGSKHYLDIPASKEKTLTYQTALITRENALTAVGSAPQRSARIKGDLVVGGYTFIDPIVTLIETDEIRMGGPLLQNFVFTLDQKRGLVQLRRDTKDPIISNALQGIGLDLRKQKDGWVVYALIPGQPELGLRPKDIVLSVNEQPTLGLDFSDWEQLIHRREPLRLQILRGKEQFEVVAPIITLVP